MSHIISPIVSADVSELYKRISSFAMFFLLGIFSAQAQQGLKVEYYNGIDFDRLVTVQYESIIDQSWNTIPPVVGLDPHSCSIRWTGKLKVVDSREYEFSVRVDDGIRVWIDDVMIINQWELHDEGNFQSNIDLKAGQEYGIKVEYFNALKEGEVRLLWTIPSEEQSWYEYFFEEAVIPVPYQTFFRPEEPEQIDQEIAQRVEVEKPAKLKPNPSPPKQKKSKPITEKKLDTKQVITTVEQAKKFIPSQVAFERGKSIILDSSTEELNLFAQFMLDQPKVNVMIEGHTDPVGDAKLNLDLSKQRAYKVANFLVKKGVDVKRIKADGFGGTQPLVVPKEGEYYPANRRVVFVLSGLE